MGSKVVVVVVIYNGMRNDWLQKCLSNLYDSNIPINVIAIDNSSVDNSVPFVKENFPNITLIESRENLGFGSANNIGIKMAYDQGAEFVLLLNQDVQIERDTIQNLLTYYERENDFGIISPMHLAGNGKSLDYNFSLYISAANCANLISDIYLNSIKKHAYETEFVNAACWLITRKCIETVGGFDPLFYHYAEDNNYIDRLHFHGLKIGICPSVRIIHERVQVNSKFFFNKEALNERNLLLKSLNPLEEDYLTSHIYTASRNIYYYLFTCRFSKVFENYRKKRSCKLLNKR